MKHRLGGMITAVLITAAAVAASALSLPIRTEIDIAEVISESFVATVTLVLIFVATRISKVRVRSMFLLIGVQLLYLVMLYDLLDEIFAYPGILNVLEDTLLALGLALFGIGAILFVGNQAGSLRDVEEARNRLAALSITDGLTGLFNSRHFYEQIKHEIGRSNRYERPLSILLLDMDNFKEHNDEYGHLAGDKVLKRLGELVISMLRENDSAYRYGGEEFTVLLPESGEQTAVVVAERIRVRFSELRFDEGVSKTISIGVAEYAKDEELVSFIKRADNAMYLAKRNGKNMVAKSVVADL